MSEILSRAGTGARTRGGSRSAVCLRCCRGDSTTPARVRVITLVVVCVAIRISLRIPRPAVVETTRLNRALTGHLIERLGLAGVHSISSTGTALRQRCRHGGYERQLNLTGSLHDHRRV
jgi:hypothetical protein